jgi:uncharacterized protein YcbX
MRGEELEQVPVRRGGLEGDRLFAFRSSACRPDFPYFTARQQPEILKYRPRFRGPDDLVVEMPDAATCSIDAPGLIESLLRGVDPKHEVSLMRSDRALADAYPVSLFSVQTARQIAAETGTAEEKRRFRANIYLDLPSFAGFCENKFVGRTLRLGNDVTVAVRERDIRCMVITLHPDTCVQSGVILKHLAQVHGSAAGVYGEVVVEGIVRNGDPVELI